VAALLETMATRGSRSPDLTQHGLAKLFGSENPPYLLDFLVRQRGYLNRLSTWRGWDTRGRSLCLGSFRGTGFGTK